MIKGRLKEVYLAYTDILDRHEEFAEEELKQFLELISLAKNGFEQEKKIEITKEEIKAFEKVLKYLEQEQKGNVFGLGNHYKAELCFLKYAGIGEGMEYETGTKEDIKVLLEELMKKTK